MRWLRTVALLVLLPVAAGAQPGPSGGCPVAGCTFTGNVLFLGDVSASTIGIVSPGGGYFTQITAGNLTSSADVKVNQAVRANVNRVLAGNGNRFNNAFLWDQIGVSGTVTGSQVALNYFGISDTATNTTPGGEIDLVSLNWAGGTGIQGNREGLYSSILFSGGSSNAGGTSLWAGDFITTATGNDGGASGLANLLGSIWGGDSQAYLQSGATYYAFLAAHEFDVGVPSGASVGRKVGINIVQVNADTQTGLYDDAAIEIANPGIGTGNGGAGWLCGICLGANSEGWAFNPAATLIKAQPNTLTVGFVNSLTATNGIDFTAVAFSGNAYMDGHISLTGSGHFVVNHTTPPTVVSASGTATLDTTASDIAGTVTVSGTTSTSWTLTFGTAYAVAPHCMVQTDSAAYTRISYPTTTTTTLTATISPTAGTWQYICIGGA